MICSPVEPFSLADYKYPTTSLSCGAGSLTVTYFSCDVRASSHFSLTEILCQQTLILPQKDIHNRVFILSGPLVPLNCLRSHWHRTHTLPILLPYNHSNQINPASLHHVCPEADHKGEHPTLPFNKEGKKSNTTQEFAEVTGNPPAGMTIGLVDESNVHNWAITMDGPEGSPYVVCLDLPPNHLFSSDPATNMQPGR